ncbi:MAG TPA: phosphatase PAP2 family protein [Desulfuromonadaceae bacterium]|jgi:membrane-associated phospholipid phosphatase
MTMLPLIPVSGFADEIDTISVPEELSKGTKRLGHEAIDVATTPFQIQNGNIFMTIGVVGATALTYAFDRDIQQKLQSNKSTGMTKATDAGTLAGDPFIHLGLAALVYGAAIAADSPKWKETGEMMGEALILADASTFVIKEAVGRGRPNATFSKGDFNSFGLKKDYDSFPSMHTSSSFALASVLAATSDTFAMKTAYYSAATFVAFSRIDQNKHWASDVLFGAALGELCGRVVTGYHASGKRMAIVPQAYDSGAGLALVGKW